ncbi:MULTISPECIES: hypothetical protein [Sphingobacterium]|uniref:hypothetical protein n=1 Tax=Sphingobacterium TaxID=28453 RepID=UPI0010E3D689|nr:MULTISPECIES: hypothetical protein [Sphingobacterium]MBB2951598.1 hypothetical protein [Sphingobacterium sp. JUb56]MCW2260140.1 hypothetical protein [Sphingobacterium kitahiroshimense]TCR11069.1 hypothetical protein EDF67_104162 [Sphingobacterium sp. JUb78]
MWSLILYFLFGIGQPSSSQPTQGNPTTMQTSGYDDPDDGDGGDKGNTVPPKH